MRSSRALVAVLAAAALLTGCGDGGGEKPSGPASTSTGSFSPAPAKGTKPSPGPRPTAAQLTAALRAATDPSTGKRYTARAARCIAVALLGTDLSDGDLNAVKANIGTYTPSSADKKTFQAVLPTLLACSG